MPLRAHCIMRYIADNMAEAFETRGGTRDKGRDARRAARCNSKPSIRLIVVVMNEPHDVSCVVVYRGERSVR